MSTPKKCLFSGSFDPFTLGHENLVKRSLNIFDEITILIGVSSKKSSWLSLDQRLDMIEKNFESNEKVKVDSYSGLIVDYAKNNNINYIIRGLRNSIDFSYENDLDLINKKLQPQIESVYLMTDQKLRHINSTFVREIFSSGGDLSQYVPAKINSIISKLR